MTEKIVTYKIDLSEMPELTESEEAELKALAGVPEEAIDTSDIPSLDDSFWKVAERGKFYKPVGK